MIGFDDPLFWLVVVVLTLVVRGGLAPRWRPIVFLAATLFLFHQRPGWPIAACLLAIATYGYAAIATARSKVAVAVHVVGMGAIFVLSQNLRTLVPGVPLVDRIMPLIGLPYLFLRFVHLLIEVANGRLARPSFLVFLTYLLPFHQLLVGPVQRFPDFAEQVLQQPIGPLSGDDALRALNRITNGFIKKAILAELLVRVVGFRFESTGPALWLEMDLFALWLYFDFSGYMDLAIGVGILVGWRPPENFDWPYTSRNIVEFWNRWHITLSVLVKEYLFTPMNLALQRGVLRGQPLAAGIVCYLASMMAVGLWHRFDLQFALFGLSQGIAIATCKLWEAGIKRAFGRPGLKWYLASPVVRVLATFVTFQYVAFNHVMAFHPLARTLEIFKGLWGG